MNEINWLTQQLNELISRGTSEDLYCLLTIARSLIK